MEIILVTGTMGSGKSKFIFDFLDNNPYSFNESNISFFKNANQLRDGDYIRSLAYPDRQINSTNILDMGDVLLNPNKCIIIDEYQFFSPENLRSGVEQIGKSGCSVLILAGLRYYADGREWESFTSVIDTARNLEIEIKVLEMDGHRCDNGECYSPATYHRLKTELGTRVFEELTVEDYSFLCPKCWTDYLAIRDASVETADKTNSCQ